MFGSGSTFNDNKSDISRINREMKQPNANKTNNQNGIK